MTINTESGIDSGAPSVPIDLKLLVSEFNDQRIAEVTAIAGKREGYPAENFQAINATIEFNIPEGMEIETCEHCTMGQWIGDIIGNDTKEIKIRVKAIKNGEWIIGAKVISSPSYDSVWADMERFYVLVNDTGVFVSDHSFENKTGPATGAIAFDSLIENAEIFNGTEICASGIYLYGCDQLLLSGNYYLDENNFTMLEEPLIWIETSNVEKHSCFTDPHPCDMFGEQFPTFCDATVCGKFISGNDVVCVASGCFDYMFETATGGNGNGNGTTPPPVNPS
jgi:hypothetical protein